MIAHITVRTAKLTETVEFYQWLLGLPVFMSINTPAGKILFLGENETKFELMEDKSAEKVSVKGLTIGFAVNNLDEKIALLDNKHVPHSNIISPDPAVRYVFFTDPNGCVIQLIEWKPSK